MILHRIRSRWANGGFSRFELIVAVLFCLALIPTLRNITEENDINIFYKAAESLRNGKSPYSEPHMYGMWYYYSPLFAAVLVPFTYFPMQLVKLVWLSLGLVMVFRIYSLLRYFIPVPETKNGKWFLGCLAAATLHPVFMNLLYGQMTILMVWCCLEGCWWAMQKKEWRGAFSFAIGINIKLLPLFFFYLYLLKKNIRFLIKLGIAVGLLILIPYLFLKPTFHTDLIQQWLDMIDPRNDEHVNTVGEGGFTDFASIITKYFTSIAISTEGQLNIANLTEYEVFIVQNIFRVIVLIATAWMVLKVHAAIHSQPIREYADLAFILLCIIVAFPHQRDYSVMLAAPALGFTLYSYFILGFRPPRWLIVAMVIAAIGMGFLLFPQLFGHDVKYFCFEKRVPGLSTLLFIPLYMVWMYQFKNTPYIGAKTPATS